MLAASGWAVRSAEDMKGYNGYRVLCVPCEPSYSPLNREGLILQRYMAKSCYNNWLKAVHKVNLKTAGLNGCGQLIIWGAGMHTEYLDQLTNLFKWDKKFLVCDKDPLKQGTNMHG